MKNLYLPGSLAFLLIGLLTISSCSTKKNTFTRRVYHNLTSHYNVYWNGMDQLRQGVKEYQSTIVDNYSLVLPVYNYGDKANTATISQYSDIGITKASKTIQKHSMVFNSKEYVKWIDDAYLLIGKSYTTNRITGWHVEHSGLSLRPITRTRSNMRRCSG